jgi:hypothetical protein
MLDRSERVGQIPPALVTRPQVFRPCSSKQVDGSGSADARRI